MKKKKKQTKTTLSQEDFLKLMTTQLTKSKSHLLNGKLIYAQMAQFSQVTGITEMSNK